MSDYSFALYPFFVQQPLPAKKNKAVHYTAKIIVETCNRDGQIIPI